MRFALAYATRVEEVRRGYGAVRGEVVRTPDRLIFVVADGAGGGVAGATAAQHVCDAVIEQLGERGVPTSWSTWLAQVDSEMPRMGLAAVAVVEARGDGRIVGTSAGNCRVQLLADRGAVELTSKQHVTPLLGEGRALPVGFATRASAAVLVIATNGLWKYVPHEHVADAAAIRPVDDAVAALVRAARLRSGALRDDIAVALCLISRER